MNQDTNIQVVAVAGVIAAFTTWILTYLLPDLMATAPVGTEAGIATLIIAGIGVVVKSDAKIIT